MNTAASTRPMAMTALLTSFMALRVASMGGSPRAMLRSTFSTTTMASSTTMPMASTRPNKERLFSEKPIMAIAANVPINDTGTASNGMMDARQFCRNSTTTITTRIIASTSVWSTASMDSRMKMVVSKSIRYSKPGGKSFSMSFIVAATASRVSMALEPGNWKMAITPDGIPSK